MTVKSLIRDVRNKSGLTQIEFGKRIGLKDDKETSVQSQMSRYENGKGDPSLSLLRKMLGVVGLTLEQCLKLPTDFQRHSGIHRSVERILADDDHSQELINFVEWKAHQIQQRPGDGTRPHPP